MTEKCDRCGILGNDRRTLWMACFYEMQELGISFTEVGLHGVVVELKNSTPTISKFEEPPYEWEKDAITRSLFTLRVCKGCRAEWMEAIKKWFRDPPGKISKWNNDASTYGMNDTLPAIIADTERLKTELVGLEQRISTIRTDGIRELERREAEDGRVIPKE